jgi:hypothetical protein
VTTVTEDGMRSAASGERVAVTTTGAMRAVSAATCWARTVALAVNRPSTTRKVVRSRCIVRCR